MKPINVGLLGIGIVGGGTWEVLNRNADEIQRRAGRAINIAVVADKEVEKARSVVKDKAKVVDDAFGVVRSWGRMPPSPGRSRVRAPSTPVVARPRPASSVNDMR